MEHLALYSTEITGLSPFASAAASTGGDAARCPLYPKRAMKILNKPNRPLVYYHTKVLDQRAFAQNSPNFNLVEETILVYRVKARLKSHHWCL